MSDDSRELWSVSRRHTLGGLAAAGGYALAARPVASTAITTSSEGLDAGRLLFRARDGAAVPAYRARPAGGADHPLILVVHEIFGVHAWIEDICRRLALTGYDALAPDYFARQGDPAVLADRQAILALVASVSDTQVLADSADAIAHVRQEGGGRRVGMTGFCWGGRITWLAAAALSELHSGVAWYGRLSGDASDRQPGHPLGVAQSLRVPVLGLYAEADQAIPLDDVRRMQAALGPGSASRIALFPGAAHGFLADYRPAFDANAAARAWPMMLEWFAHTL